MYPENLQQYIPPEFDLAKYEKATNMELVHWLENLTARVLGYLTSKNVIDSLDERELDIIHKQTEANLKHGVHLNASYEQFLNLMITRDSAEYSSVIRNITYFDLFRISDSLLTDEHKNLYSNINHHIYPFLNQESLGTLNQAIEIPTLDDENLAWLEVDMNCSEAEILGAFKDWLKLSRPSSEDISRSRERKLKTFSQASLRNWHMAKVLPYVDLITWNKLQGNSLSSKIYGEILYPDPKDITEKAWKVDDTTIPYVTKLMSIETLRRMMKILLSKN